LWLRGSRSYGTNRWSSKTEGEAMVCLPLSTWTRAKPDGYTLLLTSAMTHAVNPSLYDKLPYHPLEDFEPITQFGRLPFVVLVRADSPIKTLA